MNNAGIGLAGSFLDTTPEDWKKVLDVNLWGVIHGCRLFGRQMAERGQGGHIVNTASAAAYQPSRALPAYSTSKAAVLMLSECLRAELAGQGIGVTRDLPRPRQHQHHLHRALRRASTPTRRSGGRSAPARLYGLRNYPPEKVADAILRAVARGPRRSSRSRRRRAAPGCCPGWLPGVLRALARVEPRCEPLRRGPHRC